MALSSACMAAWMELSASGAAELSDYPAGEYERAPQMDEKGDSHNSRTSRDHGAAGVPSSDP
ncbi:hypothetical protein CRG98_039288 [Punica granatum]|uniref:Uncharacterized protein n=1 Tax=Punica granatum TaxID=22663 RepID=A0A2I0I8L8_PUNGR|nr:hypothetical protein CRG98_039288 [Punica granatum]